MSFMQKQIEEMIEVGRRAGLWGMDLAASDMPLALLVCNGIGAEWFPDWLRWLVGVICPSLIVISLPHDIEYFRGGGIRDRWIADWHFLCNGLRIAWFYKSRKVAAKTVVLWIILRIFGAAAFNWKRNEAK
ncbi:hypothetical protein SDC9_96609 [bioreactor metagenome]|uniref:Uncharacterized protein n=1 Tax=bioreactor metagenome TaxID=1076179 RepID=A0A645A9J2_9ZZZZ